MRSLKNSNELNPYRSRTADQQHVSETEIQAASSLLREGNVVAFPTETVYGLGARADDPKAIQHVFELKGRPSDNPLIVHLSNLDQLSQFADEIPDGALSLLNRLWPGPLTVVLKRKDHVLDLVTGGLDTVALRIPAHPVARALIDQSGPLVAPSANRSGRPSPTTAAHVQMDFGEDLPVLDGGPCDIGLESTVLDLHTLPWVLLRPGYYNRETLEEIAGQPIREATGTETTPRSPGMKYTHYKPEAEVRWYRSDEPIDPSTTLFIMHGDPIEHAPHLYSFDGDFTGLARSLYDLFRSADQKKLTHIRIEPLPTTLCHPLIPALQNRIEKAIGL